MNERLHEIINIKFKKNNSMMKNEDEHFCY